MTISLARIINGKKFLWDGKIYENKAHARRTLTDYKNDGFEVQMFDEEEHYLVYSRRVAAVLSED